MIYLWGLAMVAPACSDALSTAAYRRSHSPTIRTRRDAQSFFKQFCSSRQWRMPNAARSMRAGELGYVLYQLVAVFSTTRLMPWLRR